MLPTIHPGTDRLRPHMREVTPQSPGTDHNDPEFPSIPRSPTEVVPRRLVRARVRLTARNPERSEPYRSRIEERVIACCWVHERNQTGKTIAEVRADFRRGFKEILLRNKDFYAIAVREYLNEALPGRWVGRGSPALPAPLAWPPRSPDLTKCDNSLWGFIKGIVSQNRYNTTDELKGVVKQAFTQVTPAMLRKMSHRTWRRRPIILCHENDGTQTSFG
ncbi:hypothetical protein ANN_08615 [Periplaneta americana]|uniref:Uncharacterized protein n=1 Tax=Periplaneta americana TaxID=6978 RepID=A0ABQ8T1X6_PERAM|nr:hypothetical protein ANN_08615 [Periplaneta americana]